MNPASAVLGQDFCQNTWGSTVATFILGDFSAVLDVNKDRSVKTRTIGLPEMFLLYNQQLDFGGHIAIYE